MRDPRQRFSDRVTWYARSRPDYPQEVLTFCTTELGLSSSWAVADIGSGTGILTALFLNNGNSVYAVEPNQEMRKAAEARLTGIPGFSSVPGSAEATTLDGQSVDLITVGQAFHWFDRQAARQEFARVLKPGGWVLLVWNMRAVEGGDFMRGYEDLLARFSEEYSHVCHRTLSQEELEGFFPVHYSREYPHHQMLDWEGLQARLLSSSYAPLAGHPRHRPMMKALRALFRRYQQAGQVRFDYRTRVYFGRLA